MTVCAVASTWQTGMSKNANRFPNGLRKALVRAGMRQADLERATGIDRRRISKWASGEQEITGPIAAQLAPPLGVSPDDLIFARQSGSTERADQIIASLPELSPDELLRVAQKASAILAARANEGRE